MQNKVFQILVHVRVVFSYNLLNVSHRIQLFMKYEISPLHVILPIVPLGGHNG